MQGADPGGGSPETWIGHAPIEALGLPLRVKNALKRGGVFTVSDLRRAMASNSLWRIHGIGQIAESQIADVMAALVPSQVGDTELSDGRRDGTERLLALPTSVLVPMVPRRLYNALKAKGVAQLRDAAAAPLSSTASRRGLTERQHRILRKALDRVSDLGVEGLVGMHRATLAQTVAAGKLCGEVKYLHIPLRQWSRPEPWSDTITDHWLILRMLSDANENTSLADDLGGLFGHMKPRELAILAGRYGPEKKTLQVLADELKLTRERVRQLERRSATRVNEKLNSSPCIFLKSAVQFGADLGRDLSEVSWRQELEMRHILGQSPQGEVSGEHLLGDTFELLLALLRLLSDAEMTPLLTIPSNVALALKSGELPVGVYSQIGKVSKKATKEVLRRINFTGGVSVRGASSILGLPEEATPILLERMGGSKILDDWYSIASAEAFKRSPFLTAGLKMQEACGSLKFEEFCDGLRRYVARFYPALAPPDIVRHMLVLLGFDIEGDTITGPIPRGSSLSRAERAFLEALEDQGGVLSLYEVAAAFETRGLSLPAVSALLQHSPIVERIKRGFYGLRGSEVSWEQLRDAKARQTRISADTEIAYGTDGIVRFRATVNAYGALTGVLNAYKGPRLGDGWTVLVEDSECGSATMDDAFVWGLDQAFNLLAVEAGSRVELAFDTKLRQVRVSRIEAHAPG